MGDFATATLKGRVVATPSKRGPVAHFAVAVKHRQGGTSYVECEGWDANASFVMNTLKAGDPVVVIGDLAQVKWQGADGSSRSEIRVRARTIEFQEGRRAEERAEGPSIDDLMNSA